MRKNKNPFIMTTIKFIIEKVNCSKKTIETVEKGVKNIKDKNTRTTSMTSLL